MPKVTELNPRRELTADEQQSFDILRTIVPLVCAIPTESVQRPMVAVLARVLAEHFPGELPLGMVRDAKRKGGAA